MDALTEYLLKDNGISVEEYEQLLEQKRQELENDPNSSQFKIKSLVDENLTNMMAIATLYETNVDLTVENEALKNENMQNMMAITELYELLMGGL